MNTDAFIIDSQKKYRRRLILAITFFVSITLALLVLLLAYGVPIVKAVLITLVVMGLPSALVLWLFCQVMYEASRFDLQFTEQRLELIDRRNQETWEIDYKEIATWDMDSFKNIYLYLKIRSTQTDYYYHHPKFRRMFNAPQVICLYHWMTYGQHEKIIQRLENKIR